jgi:hypothetical protein
MHIELDNAKEFPRVIRGLAKIPYGGFTNAAYSRLTRDTGNQWNPSWGWNLTKLEELLPGERQRLCDDVLEPENIHVTGL